MYKGHALSPSGGWRDRAAEIVQESWAVGNLHVMLHGVSMSGKFLVGLSVSPEAVGWFSPQRLGAWSMKDVTVIKTD